MVNSLSWRDGVESREDMSFRVCKSKYWKTESQRKGGIEGEEKRERKKDRGRKGGREAGWERGSQI